MEKDEKINLILQMGNVVVGILKSKLTGCEYSLPDNVDFEKLYQFCEMHKVTSLVAGYIIKCDDIKPETKMLFQKQLFRCAARHTAQEKEMCSLIEMFTENNIKHCFLKGTKVSCYYPEPELRFMLDMDIYIEPDKFLQARSLMENSGYEVISIESDKDIALSKKPFLNIDLHKELKYDYDKGYEYYKSAFSRLESIQGTTAMNMADEDFYVYILSHTAHHFETAGTGIRSVVDHYCVKKGLVPQCDADKLAKGLEDTGLSKFNERMNALCDYWFGDATPDESIMAMAQYIFLSGVYGTQTNTYMSGISRGEYSKGKTSYFLNRLFPGYKSMSARYPVLKKCPFLLPLFWFVRIVSAVFGKGDFKQEVKNVSATSNDDVASHLDFIKENGL